MKGYFSLVLLILLPFVNSLYGQNFSRLENELLIKVKDGHSLDEIFNVPNGYPHAMAKEIDGYENLGSKDMPFYKLTLNKNTKDTKAVLKALYNSPFIETVQYNHKITLRTIPNDPFFSKQWTLNNTGQGGGTVDADIDADKAWDLTTGGLTPEGDTIVIAIIDDGIDARHIDLTGNMWKNYNEIPGDSIDNDGNGYIDDFEGWNPLTHNDNIKKGNHGTSVAGIIGAKGNNNLVIAGINWDVKLMNLYYGSDEASIIACYLYVLKMRRLYNETGGQKGAYVVATNLSSGINKEDPADHPVWCAIYDELGKAGIINVCATSNISVNVDKEGDIPTACPSDYILSVTNVDRYNQLYTTASYGAQSIDVGAYGHESFTTKINNGYGTFGGCSAAAPHACGIVGLLYAYSTKLTDLSVAYPANAPLMVKKAIMDGTKPLESLKDKTVSGGVVNAYNSLIEMQKYESDCAPPVEFVFDTVAGDFATLSWGDYDSALKYNIQFRAEGGEWISVENAISPYTVTGLQYCTTYEFRIRTVCNSDTSDFGYTIKAKTKFCCDTPEEIKYQIKNDSLFLSWDDVYIAKNYFIQYKYWTLPEWDSLIVIENKCRIPYVYECGDVQVRLRSLCDDKKSDISKDYLFGEKCEYCDSNGYCRPELINKSEWIESFSLGDFKHISGKDNNGFHIYTSTPSFTLVAGTQYEGRVELGFSKTVYNDFLMIWLDYNRDNTFSENEKLFTGSNEEDTFINYSFLVPEDIEPGFTRLRVLLNYNEINDPCDVDAVSYGEYEDYCVYLDDRQCEKEIPVADTVWTTEDKALVKWDNPSGKYRYFYLTLQDGENASKRVFVKDTFYLFEKLDTCTTYNVDIEPFCEFYNPADTIVSLQFKTRCPDKTAETDKANTFIVFPNPVNDILYIKSTETVKDLNVSLYDITGHRIINRGFQNFENMRIALGSEYTPGIYILQLKSPAGRYVFKILKMNP